MHSRRFSAMFYNIFPKDTDAVMCALNVKAGGGACSGPRRRKFFVEKKTAESIITHIEDAFKRDGFESVKRSESGVVKSLTATVKSVELVINVNVAGDFITVRTNGKFEGVDETQLTEKAGDIKEMISDDKKSGITVSHYDNLIIVSSSFKLTEDASSRAAFDEIMSAAEYILSFADIPANVKNAFRKNGKDPYGYEDQSKKQAEQKQKKPDKKPDKKTEEKKPQPSAPAQEKQSAPESDDDDSDDDLDFAFFGDEDDDEEDLFAEDFGGEKEMKKPEMQTSQSYEAPDEVNSELDALLAELGMSDDASPQPAAAPVRQKSVTKKPQPAVEPVRRAAPQTAPQSIPQSYDISRQKMEMYNEIDEIFARKRKESDERESRLDDFSERLKRREQNLEKRISDFEKGCDKKVADAQSEADSIIARARKIEEEAKLKEKTADIRMKQAEETQATADRSLKNAREEKEIIEKDKKYCIEKEDAEKIVSENDRLKRQIEEKDDMIEALRSGSASVPSGNEEKLRQAISLLMTEKKNLQAENRTLRAGSGAPDAKTQALLRAANDKIKALKADLAKASSAPASANAVMSIDEVKKAVGASGVTIASDSVDGDEDEPVYVAKTDTGILIAINAAVRVIYAKFAPRRIGTIKKKLEELNGGDVRVSYATIGKDVIAKYAFTDGKSLASGLAEVIDEAKAMQ